MSFTFQRSYRGKLKAAIFDWAGTTVDYGSRAPAGVFVEVFQHYGVQLTVAQAREPMGLPKREHIARLLAMPSVASQWEAKNEKPFEEADIDRIYRRFIPMQLDCLPNYASPIPGVVEAIERFRSRGLKIGSTTGYNREMTELLASESAKLGFAPDCWVCASDVPEGRPAPWMCLQAAMRLGVHPLESIIKVGDTLPDIDEGLNAGMWTVGVAKTGNELGLSEEEVQKLGPGVLASRLEGIGRRFLQAGAHYVVDSVADCDAVFDDIEARLRRGERP